MAVARLNHPALESTSGTGPRRFLRLTLIELRFSYAWLFMPLVVAAAIWFFNALLWQPGRRWDVVSSNIAQSFLLIGPAGAMWAAFVAAREDRSRLSDLTASMPVGSLPRHLLVIGTPLVGSVLAYLIGAAAMMAWYGRAITWGGPDLDLIGFGTLVVLACAMIGAAFGRVVQGRFAPVIVSGSLFLYFVMSYSITDAGDTLRGWALLAYPRGVTFFGSPLVQPPDGLSASEPPLLAGVVICAAVIALAIAVLVGSHRRWKAALPFALIAVLGFAAAIPMTRISDADRAAAIAAIQESPVPVENPPLVCEQGTVTICLHQMDQRDLDQASEVADALLGPVQGLPGVPHTIEMREDVESEPGVLRLGMAGYELDPKRLSHNVIPAIFDPAGDVRPLTPAEQVTAAWLMAPVHPIDDAWFIAPPEGTNGDGDPDELSAWRAEIARLADRFAALSPEEQRAWLAANWDALRAGDLTLEDLP